MPLRGHHGPGNMRLCRTNKCAPLFSLTHYTIIGIKGGCILMYYYWYEGGMLKVSRSGASNYSRPHPGTFRERSNGTAWLQIQQSLKKIRTHLDLLSIPQSGGGNVKTFRWDQRLQIQNLFMAFKRIPRWK